MKRNTTGPVTIRGATYATARAAASALGISAAAVTSARKRGTLDACGLGPNNAAKSNRKATRIAGKDYPSRKDGAAALGISLTQLSTFLSVAAHLGIDVN